MAEDYLKRTIRWGLWGVGLLAALAAGLHFSLPLLFNAEAVKSRLIALASQNIPGRIEVATLRPTLFPSPRLILNEVRCVLPEAFDFHARSTEVHPEISALLTGRLRLQSVTFDTPTLVLMHPPQQGRSVPSRGWPATPFAGNELKKALVTLPDRLRLHMKDGRVRLQRGATPWVQVDGIQSRITTTGDLITLEVEGRADRLERFELQARLSRRTLDGQGGIALTGFDSGLLTPALASWGSDLEFGGRADLELTFETEGMQTHHAVLAAMAPLARLQYQGRPIEVSNPVVEGRLRLEPDRFKAEVTRLHATAPRLDASGSLAWEGNPAQWRISLQAKDTDITRLRSDLLKLFPERSSSRLFNVIKGGTLEAMTLESSAATWAELGQLRRMKISGKAQDSHIFIPGPALDLTEVNGDWQLVSGTLRTRDTAARTGRIRGRAGNLELGLTDRPATLKLNVAIHADLSELPPILRRIVPNAKFQAELARLKTLQGSTSGWLSLSGTTAQMDVTVAASDVSLRAEYDRLPTPIEIASGAFDARFTQGRLSLKGDFGLGQGLAVSTSLKVAADCMEVEHLNLADDWTSAALAFQYDPSGKLLDLSFKGRLATKTLATLWPQMAVDGWIAGDVTAQIPYNQPLRTTATGRLEARELPWPWFAPATGELHRADVRLKGNEVEIGALDLTYARQRMALTGNARLVGNVVDLALNFESEDFDLDQMLTGYRQERNKRAADGSKAALSRPALQGGIEMQIDRLSYEERVLDGLRASVAIGEDQTTVRLKQGRLCGISAEGELRATSQGVTIELKPRARQQAMQYTTGCLLGDRSTERIEGTFDVDGNLSATGRTLEEVVGRLSGKIDLKAREGRVVNVGGAGVLTNILTYLSINNLLTGDLPNLRERDFKYNLIEMVLNIEPARIQIEKADLLADALNMAGAGSFDRNTRQLDLTVLVSPLTTVDAVVRRLPLVGRILKGTLIAIPVGVVGPLEDPTVIPLSPKAVGSRVIGILEEILRTPFELIEPVLPSPGDEEKDRTETGGDDRNPAQAPAP